MDPQSATHFLEPIQAALDAEADTREVRALSSIAHAAVIAISDQASVQALSTLTKQLERSLRAMQSLLMQGHAQPSVSDLNAKVDGHFILIRQTLQAMSQAIPTHQFYRYNHSFNYSVQSACFLCAFWVYLSAETLITPQQLESMLGAPLNMNNDRVDFHIPLEDFLHGLAGLPAELSRLAINSCTNGDYKRVLRIKQFVQNLYSGFATLNLKNDSLRKRYDGIKYEVKRIEEIVYDIKLRKLDAAAA
ncbi:Translin-1 [Sorochytrium milnesiophthora]